MPLYTTHTDKELALLFAKTHDQEIFEELWKRLKNWMIPIAKRFYGDIDDAMQEIALALWRGLKVYNGQTSVRNYAYMIARRCYVNNVKYYNRQCRNRSYEVSLNAQTEIGAELGDLLESPSNVYRDVENLIFLQNLARRGEACGEVLSEMEKRVAFLLATVIGLSDTRGENPKRIQCVANGELQYVAKALGIGYKSVDNALRRIRKKLSV